MTRAQKYFMAMLREGADIEGVARRRRRSPSRKRVLPYPVRCRSESGRPAVHGNCAWEGYAEDCGLTVEEACEIVQAADGDYRQARKDGNVPRLRELEAAMLEACGLS